LRATGSAYTEKSGPPGAVPFPGAVEGACFRPQPTPDDFPHCVSKLAPGCCAQGRGSPPLLGSHPSPGCTRPPFRGLTTLFYRRARKVSPMSVHYIRRSAFFLDGRRQPAVNSILGRVAESAASAIRLPSRGGASRARKGTDRSAPPKSQLRMWNGRLSRNDRAFFFFPDPLTAESKRPSARAAGPIAPSQSARGAAAHAVKDPDREGGRPPRDADSAGSARGGTAGFDSAGATSHAQRGLPGPGRGISRVLPVRAAPPARSVVAARPNSFRGRRIGDSSPARERPTSFFASRVSVVPRGAGRRGMRLGLMTSQRNPQAAGCRWRAQPRGPASEPTRAGPN
jgi:hypothetical protein